jgi:hypothetical protein
MRRITSYPLANRNFKSNRKNKMNDLFEYPELWPANLRALLLAYITKEQSYSNLIQLENDLFKIGYSFAYGLDCVPYNLHKIQP